MDRFVLVKQKKNDNFTGREKLLETLQCIIRTNSSVCVYGPSGVGKTHLIKKALEGFRFVDYNPDLIDRIRDTNTHVVVDDFEVPKTLPLSNGSLIIESRRIIEGFDCIQVPPLDVENLIVLGHKHHPDADISVVRREAEQSNGNIRRFLFSLDNFDTCITSHMSSKEFIYELLCKNGTENPSTCIGMSLPDHGFLWGVVHENYTDSPNSLDWYADIADCMSLADIEDDRIYRNYSNSSMFSLLGIILPAIKIDHTLDRSTLRPGSAWTKFNNFKMRNNRFQSLTNRKHYSTMDIDSITLIYQHCKIDPSGSIAVLKEYGFEAADIDMMNHLSLINKIKPRVLQNIKKNLR